MALAAVAEQPVEEHGQITLRLQPKQVEAFTSRATEILLGGAAFGGKSFAIRVAAISWCVAIPGLQFYLFRKSFPDLYKNHIDGPSGFPELLAPWVESGAAKLNLSSNRIEIGKSRIHLCHCEYEKDVFKYQGAEIHVLAIDELTQFSASMYRFLRSRVRMVGLEVPPDMAGIFPRVLASSNPGNIGHNWVKAAFLEGHAPGEIWRTPPSEGGMLRQFIPARMTDNAIGMAADPDYRQRLQGLGSPELVRAMEEGDWNIVAGGALDDLWTVENNPVVDPFPIPSGWRIDRSFDWGSSKPFSVGWWAESNGESVDCGNGRIIHWPKGTLVQIAEWYGWNGQPNEGTRMLAAEIARGILKREQDMGLAGRVKAGPADPAIYAVENGNSIADDMARSMVKWTPADAGPGSRIAAFEQVRKRLTASRSRPVEEPALFFFSTCAQSIRTLPVLPRDERKPDDVATEAEDHVFDMVKYRCYTKGPGPMTTSKRPF